MNVALKHRIFMEIFISLFLFVFYAALYFYADEFIIVPIFADSDPVFFPKIVSLVVVAFASVLIFDSLVLWVNYKKNTLTHRMKALVTDHQTDPIWGTVLYVCVLFLYLLGFHYIGFVYATPIVVVVVAKLLGMKNIFLGLVAAIIFTLALDYASLHFLQIMLPKGSLFS